MTPCSHLLLLSTHSSQLHTFHVQSALYVWNPQTTAILFTTLRSISFSLSQRSVFPTPDLLAYHTAACSDSQSEAPREAQMNEYELNLKNRKNGTITVTEWIESVTLQSLDGARLIIKEATFACSLRLVISKPQHSHNPPDWPSCQALGTKTNPLQHRLKGGPTLPQWPGLWHRSRLYKAQGSSGMKRELQCHYVPLRHVTFVY